MYRCTFVVTLIYLKSSNISNLANLVLTDLGNISTVVITHQYSLIMQALNHDQMKISKF